jgi:hypothetical protein
VLVEQAGEAVVDGRAGDGVRAVDAAGDLVGTVAQVDDGAVTFDLDGGADGDHGVSCAVVVHVVFEGVLAVGDGGDGFGHEGLGVVEEGLAVMLDAGAAVAVDHALEGNCADVVGGELGVEVAEALVGGADGGEDLVEEGVVASALGVEEGGFDADAFLVDVGGEGHGAGGGTADVGVVGAVARIADDAGRVLCENGSDNRDVGKVGTPREGVVDNGDVAFLEGSQALQDGGDAGRHGAQVHRDVGGLGEEVAIGREQGAGEVAALLDVGRERDPLEGEAHFFGGGFEEVAEEFELDGVRRHWSFALCVRTTAPFSCAVAVHVGGM